jgi:drug/metabolite transporter superfamily protein YnfA
MFVGHLGVGLSLKKIDKRINLGWIFFTSLFPDFLLGILILLGVENIIIPVNYDQLHYFEFSFPYSHGLIAILIWTGIVFLLARNFWPTVNGEKTKAALIFSSAIFLHFIMDLIVHIPDIPILNYNSAILGFGLWNHMTLALIFEISLVIFGLIIYLKSTKATGFGAKYGLIFLMIVLTLFNVLGQTIAPAPTDISGPAISFVAQPIIISGIAYWLDKKRS